MNKPTTIGKHFFDLEVGDVVCYPTGEIVGVIIPFQIDHLDWKPERYTITKRETCFVSKDPNYWTSFWITLLPSNPDELRKVEAGRRPDLTSYNGEYIGPSLFPEALNGKDDFYESQLKGNIFQIIVFARDASLVPKKETTEQLVERFRAHKTMVINVLK